MMTKTGKVKWTPGLEADLRKAVKQYQAEGMSEKQATRRAAQDLKIGDGEAYQKNYKLRKAEEWATQPKQTSTVAIRGDDTVTSDKLILITEAQSKDKTALLIAHGFDPEKWTLIEATSNMWHGSRPHDLGLRVHCQSKIRAKPLTESGITKATIDGWFASLGAKTPAAPAFVRRPATAGPELEVCATDIHVGGDNNGRILERVNRVMMGIAEKAKTIRPRKITLSQIGDIFQYDNSRKETANGTPQQSPLDFPPMFDTGAELLIFAVKTLAEIAPVEFVNIPGNHDRLTAYALGRAIQFYFRNDERITFDVTAENPWKYKMFFDNLVMWTHGDMNKNNLKSLLHREARAEYGRSKQAEIHVGHFHHERTIEGDGVTLRYVGSMARSDSWHKRSGYTGARENVTSFVWSDGGLEEIWYSGAV